MLAHNRKLLGQVFLVLTLLALVTALGQGGWWWLCVALFSALALWGIGPSSGSSSGRQS